MMVDIIFTVILWVAVALVTGMFIAAMFGVYSDTSYDEYKPLSPKNHPSRRKEDHPAT